MKSRGFALTELIVVIAIIGIILAITSINFGSWMRKYGVEAQIKEMHNDLSDVRLKAVHSKMRHEVVLNPSSYTFVRYSSEGATGTTVFRKDLKYPVKRFSSGVLQDFTGDLMRINTRGYTFDPYTIVIPGQANAGTDCLVVSTTRVNMGKYDATTQNCSFK